MDEHIGLDVSLKETPFLYGAMARGFGAENARRIRTCWRT
jgi:hypothetical protein